MKAWTVKVSSRDYYECIVLADSGPEAEAKARDRQWVDIWNTGEHPTDLRVRGARRYPEGDQ